MYLTFERLWLEASTNEFTMSIQHVLHVHSNFLGVHVSIFYIFLLNAGNYMRYYEECLKHKIDISTIKYNTISCTL